MTMITVGGLNRLIMRSHSRLRDVEEIQDWITDEVMPSIYKSGSYVHSKAKAAQAPSEAQLLNAKARALNAATKACERVAALLPGLCVEAKQALCARATLLATGVALLPEPVVAERTVTLSEIGKELGLLKPGQVSHLGRVATQAGIRTPAFCKTHLVALDDGSTREQDRWVVPQGVEAVKRAYRDAMEAKAAGPKRRAA